MMVFADMLVEAAQVAGMEVPEDTEDFDKEKYPHFYVFCETQLARPLTYWGEHWENAKIIANIPDAEITEITLEGLLAKGLHYKQ